MWWKIPLTTVALLLGVVPPLSWLLPFSVYALHVASTATDLSYGTLVAVAVYDLPRGAFFRAIATAANSTLADATDDPSSLKDPPAVGRAFYDALTGERARRTVYTGLGIYGSILLVYMLVWYNCVLMAIDERSYLSAKRTKSLSNWIILAFLGVAVLSYAAVVAGIAIFADDDDGTQPGIYLAVVSAVLAIVFAFLRGQAKIADIRIVDKRGVALRKQPSGHTRWMEFEQSRIERYAGERTRATFQCYWLAWPLACFRW